MPKRRSKRKAAKAATAAMASCVRTVESDESSTDDEMPVMMVVSSSESENESEDEDALHGPCGEEVCGADPPPRALRTYLGRYVAKEFAVDKSKDLSLFWGEIVNYEPTTKQFSVSFFGVIFHVMATLIFLFLQIILR